MSGSHAGVFREMPFPREMPWLEAISESNRGQFPLKCNYGLRPSFLDVSYHRFGRVLPSRQDGDGQLLVREFRPRASLQVLPYGQAAKPESSK